MDAFGSQRSVRERLKSRLSWVTRLVEYWGRRYLQEVVVAYVVTSPW